MVWWLFLKKRGISHLKKIEYSLKNSFNNIKLDINTITKHIHKHEDSINNYMKE